MTVNWGDAERGLRLGLADRGDATVDLVLENVGAAPQVVFSHVQADDIHLDPFTVTLGERRLRFVDMRDESSVVCVTLAPGESLTHSADLRAWAERLPNGLEPLEPGSYEARARYEVVEDVPRDAWTGALESAAMVLDVR